MEKCDFMIGNYLQSEKGVFKISSFDGFGFILGDYPDNRIACSDWDKITEIPISKQWLKAFGGKEDEDGVIHLEYNNIRFYLVKDFIQVCAGYSPMFNAEHIKNVHQLQNLFYTITNSELTINENERVRV